MSIISELKRSNLLDYVLRGVRGVIEKELDIPGLIICMSETFRQEMVRKAHRAGDENTLKFPYSYLVFDSIAATRDRQNNTVERLVGSNVVGAGSLALAKKAYLFSVDLGLTFHYVDSSSERLLLMAAAIPMLSSIGGLRFKIKIGNGLEIGVHVEIPLDMPTAVQEEQSSSMPGATDLTCSLIVHAFHGFMRDVSATNGNQPIISVQTDATAFSEGNSFEV